MPQYNPDFILPTLARKPDTAHPYDEEFDEGTTLDAVWNARKSDGTAIGISSSICSHYNDSSEFRININSAQRPSFLRAQPITGETNHIWRALTVPENFLIYMRFTWTNDTSITNPTEGNIVIELSEADSGDPSLPGLSTNSIRLMMHQSTSYPSEPIFQKRTNGVAHNASFTERNEEGSAVEYLAIHKVGTTYHAWVGTESNWIRTSPFQNVSYNMTHLVIHFKDAAEDHNVIHGIDFIRFLETDKFPF